MVAGTLVLGAAFALVASAPATEAVADSTIRYSDAVAATESGNATDLGAIEPRHLDEFASDMESVRSALGLPGMAAAVVAEGKLIWAEGFGFADIEGEIEVTPHTPFGLASVTKPIGATLVMQIAEEGLVDLDAPLADYGVSMPDSDGVTVRHLLNHTSEGTPGAVHDYNGDRYGYLGGVMEAATGKSFADLLGERFIIPLGMTDTAVNPLDSWSGVAVGGMEGLGLVLGWGDAVANFPDVYNRLAQPYQFDDQYNIVPGMYQLTHSPAAGGLSSVADLARFDIALDNGELLGEAAYREMLAPSVRTVQDRPDLTYALGWYVQDFDDLQLIWHTGRWQPSTSALYLKVPEFDLTFVVLANTDNLTVPFPGIGQGDLSKSLPMLTFLHHLVYPIQHGYSLPPIDWSADVEDLAAQLAGIEADPARTLLERELWSRRQALASSGQFDRAEDLAAVARVAFPGSPMRLDESVVSTVGKMPYVAPVTSARTLMTQTRVIIGWLAIAAISLVAMAVQLLRERDGSIWGAAVWLLATLLLGPIAVAAYFIDRRQEGVGRAAVCGGLFCIAGYAVGWVIALVVLRQGGEDPNPLLVLGSTILIPYFVGLVAVMAPILRKAGTGPLRRGSLASLITWGVGLAVFFPLTFFFDNRWLSTIPAPTSPYFGAMMSIMALVGLILLVPTNLLLRRRGFVIWVDQAHTRQDAPIALPTLRQSWRLVLGSVIVAITGIVIAVGSFA